MRGGRNKKNHLINNISTDAKFFIYNTCIMLNFFQKLTNLLFHLVVCVEQTQRNTKADSKCLSGSAWDLVGSGPGYVVGGGLLFLKKSSALTLLSVYSDWLYAVTCRPDTFFSLVAVKPPHGIF